MNFAKVLDGRFEATLTDAAPRSNGRNVGETGCYVSVRYAYS
jgi:hypothetical protein